MKNWELYYIIPALALFTLIFFIAFDNYTINEWLLGNGIVTSGIGFVYLGENIKKRYKK